MWVPWRTNAFTVHNYTHKFSGFASADLDTSGQGSRQIAREYVFYIYFLD